MPNPQNGQKHSNNSSVVETNFLSFFDHFVGFMFKELNQCMEDSIQNYTTFSSKTFECCWESEAHSEPSQISKMEHYAKISTSWQPFPISAKSSILDVWLCSEYALKAATGSILKKDVFLKISLNSPESTCARVSLRTPFFTEHLRWLFLTFIYILKIIYWVIS